MPRSSPICRRVPGTCARSCGAGAKGFRARALAIGVGTILLGTSGWEYPEWVGPVYPKRGASDHLLVYARRFPIVEINTTFYRTPPAADTASWARRTPKGFRFTAKLPQSITHERRLVGVEAELAGYRAAIAPLKEAGKLLASLVQLPPSLPFDPAVVRSFYERLTEDGPIAVEFRERSWLAPESFDLLKEFRYAYVVVDEPLLPVRLELTAPFAYVRWHGHGAPVWYDYRVLRAGARRVGSARAPPRRAGRDRPRLLQQPLPRGRRPQLPVARGDARPAPAAGRLPAPGRGGQRERPALRRVPPPRMRRCSSNRLTPLGER